MHCTVLLSVLVTDSEIKLLAERNLRGDVRTTGSDLRGDRAYLNERLCINQGTSEEANLTATEFRDVAAKTEEAKVV